MKKWKCYRKTDQHKAESVFNEKGLKVCDINYYLSEESESNAKLISCAPEMLFCIKDLIKEFEYHGFKNSTSINNARQLIIKATLIN